jgi:hypothetical protein
MRRNLPIAIGLVVLGLMDGCSSSGSSASPTPTLPVTVSSSPSGVTGGTGTIIHPSGSGVPTSSPGVTGSVTTGNATVTVTGGENATVRFTKLTGGIWAPPPGGMALAWGGTNHQTLSIGGPAFTSQEPTSASHVLAFAITGPSGALLDFRSAAGECLVTINPALSNDVGGIFDCASLGSTDGSVTVHAQGSFTATG